MPNLSVIVPTLDATITLPCEPAIESSGVDVELIVRDDESASAARNAGIREATADKLVFLDDDSTPREGYFDRAVDALDDYHAVTGRVIDTGWGPVTSPYPPYDNPADPQSISFVLGCNMAFRRRVFETVGPFDERLPYGHEEVEFADRVAEQFDIRYLPEMTVEHPYANGLLDYWGKSYRHGRERIFYWAIRGENPVPKAANNSMSVRGFSSSPQQTLIHAGADAFRIVGYVRGLLEYRFKQDRDTG